MKIAVPVNRLNQIDGHFGHCEFFNIYTISDVNEISGVEVLKSDQGCGCKSNISLVLASKGVTVMLAGGIGSGAINVLSNAGIEVISGCSGNSADAVKGFISGLITDSGVSCRQHEEHQHTCEN